MGLLLSVLWGGSFLFFFFVAARVTLAAALLWRDPKFRPPDPTGKSFGASDEGVDDFGSGFGVAEFEVGQLFKERGDRLVVDGCGHAMDADGQGVGDGVGFDVG